MKKKFASAAIVFAAAALFIAAVIGVAFSDWIFGGSDDDTNITVNIEESSNAQMGEWDTSDSLLYAVVDGAVGSSTREAITGITFYKGSEDSVVMDKTFTVTFTCTGNTSEGLAFGIGVSLTGALADYFEKSSLFETAAGKSDAVPDGYASLTVLGDDELVKIKRINTEEDGCAVVQFKINTGAISSFFSYKDGKLPTTQEAYDALRTNLQKNNSKLTLYFWQGQSLADGTGGTDGTDGTDGD